MKPCSNTSHLDIILCCVAKRYIETNCKHSICVNYYAIYARLQTFLLFSRTFSGRSFSSHSLSIFLCVWSPDVPLSWGTVVQCRRVSVWQGAALFHCVAFWLNLEGTVTLFSHF